MTNRLFHKTVQVHGDSCFLPVHLTAEECLGEYINDNRGKQHYVVDGPKGLGIYFQKGDTEGLDPTELSTHSLNTIFFNGNKIPNALFGREYGFGFADGRIQLYHRENNRYELCYRDHKYSLISRGKGGKNLTIYVMSPYFDKNQSWEAERTGCKSILVSRKNLNDPKFGDVLYEFSTNLIIQVGEKLNGISTEVDDTGKNWLHLNTPKHALSNLIQMYSENMRSSAREILKPETFSI